MSNKETPQQEPENFLGRWARLKQQNTPLAEGTVKQDAAHPLENPAALSGTDAADASVPAPVAEDDASNAANATDAANDANTDTTETPVLTDADMPPLETLDEKSDYSGFFSAGVSEELRKLALRKLFHTPTFNIRDGLDDYDGDYTQYVALGDIITTDMKHQMKVEARRALEKLEKETRAQSVAATSAEETLEETGEETAETTPVEEVETEAKTAATTETETETETQIIANTETTEEKPA